jgi:hypothetical protein
MAVDHIRYDLLTQEAMRGVMRTVLRDAAAKGLPGEHHFFVTFDTRAPGVKMSPRLLAQYAEEMTIVLQHQFWDMTVTDDSIEVGLSFNGVPERLTVPFAAIKGFFDPSVKFGLQFAEITAAGAATNAEPPKTKDAPGTEPRAVQPAASAALPAPPLAAAPAAAQAEPEKSAGGGAEVVRLDRFRKK